ncbi:putative zinc finger CONSTANS-LIKE 11 -like protein [Tripterygium wilfordii]|uniref:Putative zinc finger CONSTANS-LIKE 11 -like protein n=1 Tax=Tripterygium wilfordii TaxID=458696 RepID=A0A7J7D531_TRIWF|nr:zinc finger protein CONSTANS-LIKE 2-like [Tripterygium wilfordii]KAF5741467.1 putative zinc finger CONSTANS-LIKE 11 -like protein [Tripterygium wilfordii]
MKSCELCKTPATTYCESDQASLCWNCDAKVHGANFLVARHSRTLLCRACQSPTPWKASGARLGSTVSACERCVNGTNEGDEESEAGNDDDLDTEDEDLDHEEEVDVQDEDGDNQVVPWSSSTTPPPAASSSSSEDSVTRISGSDTVAFESINSFTLKRVRENDSDLRFQEEEFNCSSSRLNYVSPLTAQAHQSKNYGEATSGGSTRRRRNQGAEQDTQLKDQDRAGSRSM